MDTPIDKVSQKYVKWFRYKPEQEILGLNSNCSTGMRVCGEHVNCLAGSQEKSRLAS
jgi:hypothetical protein